MQTTEPIQQLADTVHDKGSSPYVDHDCPSWCGNSDGMCQTRPDVHECDSTKAIISSVPGDVPDDLGKEVELQLWRFDGRDCISIGVDQDAVAWISAKQARRLAEDLLALADRLEAT